jgi:hypothetical protein
VWVFLRGQRSGRRRHQHNHSITWCSLFFHFLGIRPLWYYDVLATCCRRSKHTGITVIVIVISQTIKRRRQCNVVRPSAIWDKSAFSGTKVSYWRHDKVLQLWCNVLVCLRFVCLCCCCCCLPELFNLLKPTGYVMHHQSNIQQLYALPTLYLYVLYLSENKQRLMPLTA